MRPSHSLAASFPLPPKISTLFRFATEVCRGAPDKHRDMQSFQNLQPSEARYSIWDGR